MRIPEWLSDHPDSQSRVDEVRRVAQELGCSTELSDQAEWRAFQASLPPVAGEEMEDDEGTGDKSARAPDAEAGTAH